VIVTTWASCSHRRDEYSLTSTPRRRRGCESDAAGHHER
jgi:hypothetical protein